MRLCLQYGVLLTERVYDRHQLQLLQFELRLLLGLGGILQYSSLQVA
jgi:hypothetical protein